MKREFNCCDCGGRFEQEHNGGRKRLRCPVCSEKKNRERSLSWNRKNRDHKRKASPSIPYRQFHDYEEDRVPMIPPADRLRLAQERKLAEFSPEHREAFLNGVARKQFERDGRFL